MKRILIFLLLFLFLFSGCSPAGADAQVAATTLPVYEFTLRLCEGTGITVTRLVTQNVSCLHDYALNVSQVRAVESAETVVISGAGLEEFMDDVLDRAAYVVDASAGIHLHEGEEHDSHTGHDHHHAVDSHIWLSPALAKEMAQNICAGLSARYPRHRDTFEANLASLLADLDALQAYGDAALSGLSCRDLITFHDGFGYFAESFDLHILKAVEEESGSEASAADLKDLITLVRAHDLPAIFTETNGSASAAAVISRETGAAVFTLDMAMAGESYFTAMYHNIDTLKEALA